MQLSTKNVIFKLSVVFNIIVSVEIDQFPFWDLVVELVMYLNLTFS